MMGQTTSRQSTEIPGHVNSAYSGSDPQNLIQNLNSLRIEDDRSRSFQNQNKNSRCGTLDSRFYNVESGTLGFYKMTIVPRLKEGQQTPPLDNDASTLVTKFFTTFRQPTGYTNGYGFISEKIKPGESFVIKIVQTEKILSSSAEASASSRQSEWSGIGLGFTLCDPKSLSLQSLPLRNPNDLLERPEYWVLNSTAAVGCTNGDEFCVTFETTGKILIGKNGAMGLTVIHLDNSSPLWAFFTLFGSITEISVLGKTWIQRPESPQESNEEFLRRYFRTNKSPGLSPTASSQSKHSKTRPPKIRSAFTSPKSQNQSRSPQVITPGSSQVSGSSSSGPPVTRRHRRGRLRRAQSDPPVEIAKEITEQASTSLSPNQGQTFAGRARGALWGPFTPSRRRGRHRGHSHPVQTTMTTETSPEPRPGGSRVTPVEGDWVCPDAQCGALNFAARSNCIQCNLDKPGKVPGARVNHVCDGGIPNERGRGRGKDKRSRGHKKTRCQLPHGLPLQPDVAQEPANLKEQPVPLNPSQTLLENSVTSNENNDDECIICCEKQVDTVFLPCGHICLCFECATNYWDQQQQQPNPVCPICRMTSNGFIKTFKS